MYVCAVWGAPGAPVPLELTGLTRWIPQQRTRESDRIDRYVKYDYNNDVRKNNDNNNSNNGVIILIMMISMMEQQ